MATVSQRAIDSHVPRPRREHSQDLGNHDRPVRAGGRLARGNHLGHVIRVAVGLVLLVFLMELARILAAIPRPTLRFFGSGVGHRFVKIRSHSEIGSTNVAVPGRVVAEVEQVRGTNPYGDADRRSSRARVHCPRVSLAVPVRTHRNGCRQRRRFARSWKRRSTTRRVRFPRNPGRSPVVFYWLDLFLSVDRTCSEVARRVVQACGLRTTPDATRSLRAGHRSAARSPVERIVGIPLRGQRWESRWRGQPRRPGRLSPTRCAQCPR